jgi:hypothetical protein
MNNLYKIVFISLGILILNISCSSLPRGNWSEHKKIETGFGPEDMVIDSFSNIQGILISSCSRREEYGDYGEIERFIPGTIRSEIVKRIGEPENMVFKPHGISIAREKGDGFLYVISHDDENNKQFIIKYKIEADHLAFERLFESPLLVSPNALHAFGDGRLLVCNDAKKRNSLLEKILKLKTSNIVYFNENENWEIIADKIGYAAGLEYSDGKFFVSAALENKLYSFDFDGKKVSNKKVLAKINGPDNIRLYKDKLIVAAHYKAMAFIKHVNSKEKYSPSTVYSIDQKHGNLKLLYSNDGSIISGSSTAVIYKERLFINQIFEPWIIEIPISPGFTLNKI